MRVFKLPARILSVLIPLTIVSFLTISAVTCTTTNTSTKWAQASGLGLLYVVAIAMGVGLNVWITEDWPDDKNQSNRQRSFS